MSRCPQGGGRGELTLSTLHFQLPSLPGLFPAICDVQAVVSSSLLPMQGFAALFATSALHVGSQGAFLSPLPPLQFQPALHPCFGGTICPASSLPSLGAALLFPAPPALPLCSSSGFCAQPSYFMQICTPSEPPHPKALFATPAGSARNFLCRCIFCGSEPQSKKSHWTAPPACSTDPLNPAFPELTLLTSPSEPSKLSLQLKNLTI